MNCFDCSAIGESSTAVAVCRDCGAAVCADHAVARDAVAHPSDTRRHGRHHLAAHR